MVLGQGAGSVSLKKVERVTSTSIIIAGTGTRFRKTDGNRPNPQQFTTPSHLGDPNHPLVKALFEKKFHSLFKFKVTNAAIDFYDLPTRDNWEKLNDIVAQWGDLKVNQKTAVFPRN